MTMPAVYRSGLLAWIVLFLILDGSASPSQDLDAKKGDVLLKAMSQKLACGSDF